MSRITRSTVTRRRPQTLSPLVAAVGALALFDATAHAVNLTWNVGNGNFFTSTNWNPNSSALGPTSADATLFTSPSTYNVTFTLNAFTTGLTQTNGNVTFVASPATATFTDTVSGTVSQSGGTLTLNRVNLSASAISGTGGSILNVLANTTVSTVSASYGGSSGTSTLAVDGGTFNATGVASIGVSGFGGKLDLLNNAQATIGSSGLNVAVSGFANSNGTVSVQSGSDLSVGGNINVATSGLAGQSGSLTVAGAGSTATQSGATAITIGAANNSIGSVTITSSGTLTTGTGLFTVNDLGSLTLSGAGSTLNANGNFSINGGSMLVTGNSTFNWAAGKILTVTNVGYATFTQPLTLPDNATVSIQGNNSAFNATGGLTINGGAAVIAGTTSGGAVLSLSTTNVGLNTPGSLTVNNSTVNFTLPLNIGNAAAGTVSIQAGSSSNFFNSALTIGSFASAASAGTMTVDGFSDVANVGDISVGAGATAGATGTLTLSGGSLLAQAGNVGLAVGTASAGTGTVNVTGSTLSIGTQGITINKTGTVNLSNGGALGTAGDINVTGGTLTIDSTAYLAPAAGKDMNVTAGGKVTSGNNLIFLPGQVLTVNGTNSSVITSAGIATGASLIIQNHGSVSADQYIELDGGTTLVTGSGSSLSAPTSFGLSVASVNSSTATATFSSSATGTFSILSVAAGPSDAKGTLTLSSGSVITTGALNVGSLGTNNTGAVTVTGVGSSLTVNGAFSPSVQLGAPSGTAAALTVADSATFSVPTATLSLNPTGTLTLDGGTLSVLAVFMNGGTFDFRAGQVQFLADTRVGTGYLLGTAPVLSPGKAVTVNGPLAVDAFRTLTLSGGSVTATNLGLAPNATFNFAAGTLTLTAATGVTFGGATSPFGAVSTLNPGATLVVPNYYAIVGAGSLLVLDGTLRSGASYGTINNGEIRLYTAPGSAPATIAGGTLTNYKLLNGTGTISATLSNQPAGEVRATSSDHLTFTSNSNLNFGKINLLAGGTVEFTGALTNANTGTITGAGTLITGTGLTNAGKVSFTGDSDVLGPVTNNKNILITGGATATFRDPVTNAAGADINTAANSAVVFLQPVTGTGTFSGTGTKYFSDGSSTTSALEPGGITVVAEPASLTTPDFIEQQLIVSGNAITKPSSAGGKTSKINSLVINPTGTLDLADNRLILDYSGASPIDQLRLYLLSGRNGGAWNGDGGLLSSLAAANPNHTTAIAYAESAQLNVLTWGGLPVDATTLLTKYTYYGDLNLDGRVNADDFALFDRGLAKHLTGWTNGDVNYDNTVNAADALLIDTSYALQGGPLSPEFLATRESQFGADYVSQLLTSVPEPSSLLAACGLALLPIVRRRRHS